MEKLRSKRVGQVMSPRLWAVDGETTAGEVERLFVSRRLSSVPVVDRAGRLFGVLSAADLLRLHAEKKNLHRTQAWEICGYRAIKVSSDTSLADVAGLMLKKRIHHVAVVDFGVLKGIVSAMDLVEQIAILAADVPAIPKR